MTTSSTIVHTIFDANEETFRFLSFSIRQALAFFHLALITAIKDQTNDTNNNCPNDFYMISERRALDTAMAQEEKRAAAVPSSVLRPSAPVFIPSGVTTFAAIGSEQTDEKGRGGQKSNGDGKKKKRPRRQKRGQRRRESDETSRKLDPKNHNTRYNENNVANSKNTKKSRPRNNKSSQRPQKHNRRSRRRNQNPRDDSKPTFEGEG